MATNSFLGFSEDGTELFEMKSKLARQVGNDVSASVKTSIRSTLGVPGIAEGLTPSNNLSDVSSASTSRTNLDVMATADVNDRQLSKAPGNGLYFDGTNDYVNVGDQALLEFGNAVTDTPFSIHAVVKFYVAGAADPVVSKSTGSAPNNEYLLTKLSGDTLRFEVMDSDAANYLRVETNSTVPIGEWIDISVTYDGSSTDTGLNLYINGVAVAQTRSSNAYTAMHAGGALFEISKQSTDFANQDISSVHVFNRELTAAEALRLSIENVPEVPDQWGKANLTSGTLEVGKMYRLTDWISGDSFTNVGASSNADGVEFVATATTPTTWTNSSIVTPLGAVLSLEQGNIEADGTWIDATPNELNGTNNGATPLIVPPQTSGTWTPSMSFATPVSTRCSYSQQEGTWVKLTDKTYYVRARFQLSSKGDDTGKATFAGFPWAFSSAAASQLLVTEMHVMNSLNMRVATRVTDGTATAVPYQQGASDASFLSNTHFNDTSLIMFSGVVTIA